MSDLLLLVHALSCYSVVNMLRNLHGLKPVRNAMHSKLQRISFIIRIGIDEAAGSLFVVKVSTNIE